MPRGVFLLAVIADAAVAWPDGYVTTPGGRLHHHSCVHRVPSGSEVSAEMLEPCPHPVFDASGHARSTASPLTGDTGWVMNAFMSDTELSSFSGRFTVPAEPLSPAANFYFFSGLMPSRNDWILQPVLQFAPGVVDKSVCHTSSSWEFISYWVTQPPYRVICSDPIQVNVGDVLLGNMTRDDQGRWAVHSSDLSTGEGPTSIFVPAEKAPLQVVNLGLTLEMYGCDAGCDCYPGGASVGASVSFSENEGLDESGGRVDLHWRQSNYGTCGNRFSFPGNGDVVMAWGNLGLDGMVA